MESDMFRSPFHPDRVPFFYGWVIVAAGTVGVLCSLPGQTIGVSAFTESLIDSLSLSRTQVSFSYFLGTVCSAFLLPLAGSAYDRFGVRWVASASSLLLGVVLGLLSRVDRVALWLSNAFPVVPPHLLTGGILAVLFFFLRFSGQGVLTLVSRNMMMKWFDRRRGIVTGITGFMISPAFSLAPWLLNRAIASSDWRTVWLGLGVAIGIGFTAFVLLFFRDHPEQFGQIPDGTPVKGKADRAPTGDPARRSFTRAQVVRTPTYWIFAFGISLFGFHVTGFSFHVASIFENAGLDPAQGFAVFIPSAVLSVLLRPAIGWSADRIPLRFILAYQLGALSLSAAGMATLGSGVGLWILIIGNGLAGASFDTIMSVVWPNFYGRAHVGAISSLAMSITVFASALAPLAYSTVLARTGGYALAGWIVFGVSVVFIVLTLRTRNPQNNP